MIKILNDVEIELPCRSCGGKTKKSIGWIKKHRHITCGCGKVISLDQSEIEEIERSLEANERIIKMLDQKQ